MDGHERAAPRPHPSRRERQRSRRDQYEVDSNPAGYVVDFRKVAIEVRWPTPTARTTSGCRSSATAAVPAASELHRARRRRADRPERARRVALQLSVAGGGRRNWLTSVFPPTDRINRGDGNLHVVVGPNTTGQPRSTTLLVAERIYAITQRGR